MKYRCPVCGYDELRRPPINYSICPCCGIEFGYSDFATPHSVLRKEWILNGAKWHSRRQKPPHDWSPASQLQNVGYYLNDEDMRAIYDSKTSFAAMSVFTTHILDLGVVFSTTGNIVFTPSLHADGPRVCSKAVFQGAD